MSKTGDEQDELIDQAWSLAREALIRGTITFETTDPAKPETRVLKTADVVDLAKFFVGLKVKKPQVITPPEDYILRPTEDDGEV